MREREFDIVGEEIGKREARDPEEEGDGESKRNLRYLLEYGANERSLRAR